MPLIIRNLTKRYPAEDSPTLCEINWDFPSGSVNAIEGLSGSGKSTLLACVGLLLPHDDGEVILDGCSILRLTGNDRGFYRANKLGFVFQDHCLIPTMTVLENVRLPLIFTGQNVKVTHAQQLLERLGIAHLADKRVNALSGGQKQRVAIARSLIGKPALLLADEPTASLDRETARLVVGLFKEQAKETGMVVLVATHDPLWRTKADQVLQLRNGRILGEVV